MILTEVTAAPCPSNTCEHNPADFHILLSWHSLKHDHILSSFLVINKQTKTETNSIFHNTQCKLQETSIINQISENFTFLNHHNTQSEWTCNMETNKGSFEKLIDFILVVKELEVMPQHATLCILALLKIKPSSNLKCTRYVEQCLTLFTLQWKAAHAMHAHCMAVFDPLLLWSWLV